MTATVPTPTAALAGPRFVRHPTGIYTIVVALFCGLLLISNIAATKLITVVDGLPVIQGIFTDGGAFLFPLTYILGDVLAEVYGLRQARRAIWLGFFLAALASVTFLVVGMAPPGPGYENQDAFLAVLGFVPRIVAASLAGYLVGQFLNAYVVVAIKRRTGERKLWTRLVGSTVVGELADTALFCFIAFAGVFPTWTELISYTITGYLYKVAVEVIFLPVTYIVIRAIKKREPDYAASLREAPTVKQLRLVVRADDYDEAVAFYRDTLGLPEEATYTNGEAQVTILDAGRATLELSNPAQVDYIDSVGDRADRGEPALARRRRGGRGGGRHEPARRRRRERHRRAGGDPVALAERAAQRAGRRPAHRVHRARLTMNR